MQPVHICNVTLTLGGSDLLDDPSLRQGLVNLWAAEAESAGLQLASLHSIGTGVRDSSEGYALAELSSGGGERSTSRARRRCWKPLQGKPFVQSRCRKMN